MFYANMIVCDFLWLSQLHLVRVWQHGGLAVGGDYSAGRGIISAGEGNEVME